MARPPVRLPDRVWIPNEVHNKPDEGDAPPLPRHAGAFLRFQGTPIQKRDHPAFLFLALISTWIAGLGRYWDHAKPYLVQSLGLGSVAYLFIFAGVLWLIGLPLKPRAWRYRDVLLFVARTSPLAWLYAVPVEKSMPLELASTTNALFLAIVATWRVLLLIHHLRVVGGLGEKASLVTAFLPLMAIVITLTALNLERATFDLMSSGRTYTAHDCAYHIVILLSAGSVLAFVPLLIAYAVAQRRARFRAARRGGSTGPSSGIPLEG